VVIGARGRKKSPGEVELSDTYTHTHTHTHTDFELRSQQGKNSTWTFLGARQSRIEEVGIF
jgi:hypothetical protein